MCISMQKGLSQTIAFLFCCSFSLSSANRKGAELPRLLVHVAAAHKHQSVSEGQRAMGTILFP